MTRKYLASCTLLIFIIGTLFSLTGQATTFQERTTAPDRAVFGKDNPYPATYTDKDGYHDGNCTWYVWGRARELLGYASTKLSNKGDAGSWYNNKDDGYARGSTPQLGAIACWNGHVAIVEKIESNGDIDTSDGNILYNGVYTYFQYLHRYKDNSYRTSSTSGGNTFQGFIYILNSATSSTSSPHIHTYDTKGYCTVCGESYDWKPSRQPMTAIYYVKAGGTNLKTRPYNACESTVTLNKSTAVSIVASVKNNFDNQWYEITYQGTTYYVSPSSLTTALNTPAPTVTGVTMPTSSGSAVVGICYFLPATIQPNTPEVKALYKLTWSSSVPAVASVNPDSGMITTWKAGDTTITATAGGKSFQYKLTVKAQTTGTTAGTTTNHTTAPTSPTNAPTQASPTVTTPTGTNDPTYSAYPSKQSVGSTNAVLAQQINKPVGVGVSKVGIILYNSAGTLIKDYSSTPSSNYASNSYFYVWYDVNGEIGVTLTPNTTYKYLFYVVINGTTYKSGTYSFTTTPTSTAGTTAPTTVNVTFSGYPAKQSIGTTNAVLAQQVNKPVGVGVSKLGIVLYNSAGTVIKDYSSTPSSNYASNSYFYIWYDVNGEMGVALTANTSYKYMFYVVSNGITYKSTTYTFTTAPATTTAINFTFSEYPAKQSIGTTNAVLAKQINKPVGVAVSKLGVILYNSAGTQIKNYSYVPSSNHSADSYFYVWYDVNSEIGVTLTSHTTYKYVFYVVANGITYTSSTYTFTTN